MPINFNPCAKPAYSIHAWKDLWHLGKYVCILLMLLIASMLCIVKYISNGIFCNSDILQLNASMIL